MTDEMPPQPPDPGGLQFDRVESTQPIVAICSGCKGPLGDPYYSAGPARICARCRDGIQGHLEKGSASARFFKAALLGLLAAIVGGSLWAFIIMKFPDISGFGAIGLGYLVGIAVRKGSEGRGGHAFQFLGLGLIYLAVATGYMGVILTEMSNKASAVSKKTTKLEESKSEKPEETATSAPAEQAGGCWGVGGLLLLLYAGAPILIGKGEPYTLLFLGIALWEGWRLNRGSNLKVSGPFRAGVGAVGG